ncbi:MAG: ATP-binding protein [Dehalococcoidia bacterium]
MARAGTEATQMSDAFLDPSGPGARAPVPPDSSHFDAPAIHRAILEGAPVGILRLARDGTVLLANNRAATLLGEASLEALVARWPREHGEFAAGLHARIDDLLAGSARESTAVHERPHADRASCWLRLTLARSEDADAVDVFIADVTPEQETAGERDRVISDLHRRAEERGELARRLLLVGEEERRRVAHDIHDGPAQLLAGSLMFLTSSRQERERGRHDVAEDYLDRGTDYLRTALADLRGVMASLRPAVLDDLGLASAISSAGEAALLPAGMRLNMHQLGEARTVDQSTEIVLYRIAQETIANAGQHSGAGVVDVVLDYRDPARITLVVGDDGDGSDPALPDAEREETEAAEGYRLGLLGLQERVELVGGTFELVSSPGGGTRITVSVPRSEPMAPGDGPASEGTPSTATGG